jgi:hypothetical protein
MLTLHWDGIVRVGGQDHGVERERSSGAAIRERIPAFGREARVEGK